MLLKIEGFVGEIPDKEGVGGCSPIRPGRRTEPNILRGRFSPAPVSLRSTDPFVCSNEPHHCGCEARASQQCVSDRSPPFSRPQICFWRFAHCCNPAPPGSALAAHGRSEYLLS